MIRFRRKQRRSVPGLNTASLPDLIFTVLFFFMIVTHMREKTIKVKYKIPQGTELSKTKKKSSTINIYIGKPLLAKYIDTPPIDIVQLNNKLVRIDEIADYVSAEKEKMSPEDQEQLTVSIKADKHTSMATINKVKLALRKAKALHISYSAEEKK